jgi:murein DD-endopeptidase MepM/ murein hydrolase activator NlpD
MLALLLPLLLAPQDASTLEAGREHTRLFYAGELEPIWDRFDEAMHALFQDDYGRLVAFHTQATVQLGEEKLVLDEKVHDGSGASVYVRTALFEKATGPFNVVWQFDTDGAISSFGIGPTPKAADSPHLAYETKTHLRLPFEGAWSVFWGGRSIEQNYHAAYPDQRFAYDFVVIQEGRSHAGNGKRNQDYHCFGLRIVAPGDGVVVSIANDVADNEPGVMNPRQALGNHVILDHGNGEFSFLAHFQKGSVRVAVGDEVVRGDLLGLAGNSGNTSEPHLHYHLQTTPVFNRGEGLPSQFLGYRADGVSVERGEPERGQVVQHGVD